MDLRDILSKITVEPIIFSYMMAIYMESIGMKSLITTKVCLELRPNDTCTNRTASSASPDIVDGKIMWNTYYDAVLFSCTLCMSLYFASWSDYFGRKIVMIIPLIGTIIASALNTVFSIYIHSSISYLFISAVISGLSFGTLGVIASSFAYVSDIVPSYSRTKRILVLEVMLFFGSTSGTFLCGEILNNLDFSVTFNKYSILFLSEGILTAVTLIYTMLRISKRPITDNNSVTENTEEILSLKSLFSLTHLKEVGKTVFKQRPERSIIFLLLISLIFVYYGNIVQLTLSLLFTQDQDGLKWSTTDFSHFKTIQFLLEGAALILGLSLAAYFKAIDVILIFVGVMSRMFGLILLGLSNVSDMVYCAAVLSMFSELTVPTLRSMLSKLVNDDEKGKIFTCTTILQTICFFTGDFMFSTIYRNTTFFPGLSFEVVAGLQVIIILIFGYLYWCKRNTVTVYEVIENEDGSTTEHCSTHRQLYFPGDS